MTALIPDVTDADIAAAVWHIRRQTNAARRRLNLPTVDYPLDQWPFPARVPTLARRRRSWIES